MAETQSSNASSQNQDPTTQNQAIDANLNPTEKDSAAAGHGRRFLGVRQRPSGRWIAEIKVSSQKLRLWLGTFDRAEDAAFAYDRAARLLRGSNAKTNFPCDGNGLPNGNPRISRLLQLAIMKSRNRSRSTALIDSSAADHRPLRSGVTDSVVENTIFCSSSAIAENKLGCGISIGGSKVYTSVFVAPSFGFEAEEEVPP